MNIPTDPKQIRIIVYISTTILFIWPWTLITLALGTGGSEVTAIVFCILLAPYFFIARWDVVGYWWRYIVFSIFVLVLYYGGQFLAIGVFFVLIVGFWLLFNTKSRQPSPNLHFPLQNGLFYVAHGGIFRLTNAHHASPSQKYALDIVRLNGVGSRAAGVYPSRLDKYAIFGSSVYSPCTGIVAEAVGDLPDLEPGHMDRENLAGNYVIVKQDDADISVILAHLMQNSLTVQPGDRVRAGQLLGEVGNSGNTSEPHLHIHAKRDGTSVIDGIGVPIHFDGRWLARNSLVRQRALVNKIKERVVA